MSEVEIINSNSALQAINKVEIDSQIATAKQYPRDMCRVLSTIKGYATLDEEIAEECFYALKRGYGNEEKIIDGLSVRMAEIFASSWGNLRVSTRIIANNGKTITAQGICQDLETNVAVSMTVDRSITYSKGGTFSQDMQVVTGNAASAIAFRNVVFKIIPKAITKKIVDEIRIIAIGNAKDLSNKRAAMIKWYNENGASTMEVLHYISAKKIEDINASMLMLLRGTATAIKEGTTTIKETFHQKDDIVEKKKVIKAKGKVKLM